MVGKTKHNMLGMISIDQSLQAEDTVQYCPAADDSAQAVKHSMQSPIVHYRRKSLGNVQRDNNRLEAHIGICTALQFKRLVFVMLLI